MNGKNEAHTTGMPDIYRFLAQSMRYPEKIWMGQEFFSGFFQIAEKIPDIPDSKPCMDLLSEEKAWLEMLQADYTRLFINAHPHVIAPPYGSIYIGADIGGQRQLLDATVRFYQQKGFDLVDQQEQPDWLVHELEFMAILAEEDHEGLESFLATHFRPWFPIFRKRVVQETAHPYFIISTHMIDFFTS